MLSESNTESWNSISTALKDNIDILDAYKAEVNEIESRLWEVLVQSSKNFSTITNWDDYRRVMGIASHKKIDVITQK